MRLNAANVGIDKSGPVLEKPGPGVSTFSFCPFQFFLAFSGIPFPGNLVCGGFLAAKKVGL